jgi:hypothetical protein
VIPCETATAPKSGNTGNSKETAAASSCADHHQPFGFGPIDQCISRRLRDNACHRRDRHDHADPRFIPVLFRQEINGEIRTKSVTHIGEKEICGVKRPADSGSWRMRGCEMLKQRRHSPQRTRHKEARNSAITYRGDKPTQYGDNLLGPCLENLP